jgi:hypothetical protein
MQYVVEMHITLLATTKYKELNSSGALNLRSSILEANSRTTVPRSLGKLWIFFNEKSAIIVPILYFQLARVEAWKYKEKNESKHIPVSDQSK